MTGCKFESARVEAESRMGGSALNEKECNIRVLSGDSAFMLDALAALDCPTCAYGILDKVP